MAQALGLAFDALPAHPYLGHQALGLRLLQQSASQIPPVSGACWEDKTTPSLGAHLPTSVYLVHESDFGKGSSVAWFCLGYGMGCVPAPPPRCGCLCAAPSLQTQAMGGREGGIACLAESGRWS